MLDILENICSELDQTAQSVASIGNDQPFGIAHNNWSFPSIDRMDLSDMVSSLASLIRENSEEEILWNISRLSDFPRRLQFLRSSTIPNIWGNPGTGVLAFVSTIDSLRNLVESSIQKNKAKLSSDEVTTEAQALKRISSRVRAMESRLGDVEPRSIHLSAMVERIQNAHDAADQLPTDLAALGESRSKVGATLTQVEKDQARVSIVLDEIEKLKLAISASADDADDVVAKCEAAYSAATSQGLAAAFSERSKALDYSMWTWVAGLIIALVLGGYFGSGNLQRLLDLMKQPNISTGAVVLNTALSLLSVAAPVWFAWLSTKQIGQRFRLAEDYAFKASVSRAYEGYRRETARFDVDMQSRLLASALDRLDEQPLRLVESATHGSPWHELLSSDLLKEAVKSVPGFAVSLTEFTKVALDGVRGKKVEAESVAKNSANPAE